MQLDHASNKQNTNKTNPNTTEQWITNIPTYTIGSSEQISLLDTHKKQFKHSTPPSQTSEEEDVDVERSPHIEINEALEKIEEDNLPDLTIKLNTTKKRTLRSNSRQLEQ